MFVSRFIHGNELKEKVSFLKKVETLSKFSEGQLVSIANVMSLRNFQAGCEIIKQGQKIDEVCFIKQGACKVESTYYSSNMKKYLRHYDLKVGDYYGEIVTQEVSFFSPL